ncbi:hypothetical protein [Actinoalloteichus sp. GBA129-24]|uniref:hypothetical protein n=1 Tax=Actinoalloteichus sp. GBA129-24 TaxID=1612551 RepID=UPI0009509532|nr:hypothetical protein [Actinoalloteichus sp. GBA129-24]APU20973.1 hypothetical protein UA75_14815 [Actinoalloteichus sp. GBA129-24]APU24222.1 hypothetical protein UA75_31295 [Actinoalloteichus sp. GBA129-24]
MTVSSWGDVTPGVPAHHHCLATLEYASDPARWADASTEKPTLVAWSPSEVITWVREQIAEHVDEAVRSEGGEGTSMAELLDLYSADPAPLGSWEALPNLWERLGNSTSRGGWAMETWKLSSGRRLVLQVLSYADRGQPPGETRGRLYEVCRSHNRPAEVPYRAPAELAAV